MGPTHLTLVRGESDLIWHNYAHKPQTRVDYDWTALFEATRAAEVIIRCIDRLSIEIGYNKGREVSRREINGIPNIVVSAILIQIEIENVHLEH